MRVSIWRKMKSLIPAAILGSIWFLASYVYMMRMVPPDLLTYMIINLPNWPVIIIINFLGLNRNRYLTEIFLWLFEIITFYLIFWLFRKTKYGKLLTIIFFITIIILIIRVFSVSRVASRPF